MKRCAQCGTEFEDEALFCRTDGTPLAPGGPRGDPYLGQLLLGQFAVEEIVGEGGMGTVYRAHQTGIDRKVALKVLRSDVANLPGIATRFTREARLASRIKNPHVAHVYLTGTLPDGNLALAMEYLEGRSLEDRILEARALPVAEAVHILRQLAEAVAEAHELGIVHRDLKPDNVMLVHSGDDDDFVKVLDFGIAKQLVGAEGASLTGVGMTLGTPLYMSPEAAAGEEIGPPADVYALGVMLYRMLSGETPFTSDNPAALLIQHLQEAPPLLSSRPRAANVPTEIEKLVHRCLAKKPADRPADGRALLRALDEAVAGGASRTPLPRASTSPRVGAAAATPGADARAGVGSESGAISGTPGRRRRVRAWLAGAAFGALVALGVAAFWPRGPSADEARVASLERRALAAYDTGDLEGPGGAIALTELLLTLREDHPAALDLRRRMLRQLLTEARDAEREGRFAAAIDRLGLAARLSPEDETLPERRRRIEQLLHASQGQTVPAPPAPSPAPDVVAGAASRAVRLTIEPAVPTAGQPATLRAVLRGVERDPARPRFKLTAATKGMRFRAVTVDATKSSGATWTAPFTFPVAGRYVVLFTSELPGGRDLDDAESVRVAPAPTAPPPIPPPEPPPPEPTADGGTAPPPEPPPPEPQPPDGSTTPAPVVEPPPPPPEPPPPPVTEVPPAG